ncbi:MAG: Crp/Fnr family transcriptional regulator [Crocinitomicaceae bacterium]|nr:Crp/Fnr family transcriptional regulator [Crocinitomicaceae bacterium]
MHVCQLKKINRKDFFIKEGTLCKYQGFVVGGTFRVFYTDRKTLEHVLYFAFKDWWIGDIASFYDDNPTNLNAQAMEDSWILAIGREETEELFAKVPKMERLFRIITQRTLSVLQKRFFLTVSANAEERYQELLHRHPGIEQLVPQHQIASYLGILPESLSRMKKQLIDRKQKEKL